MDEKVLLRDEPQTINHEQRYEELQSMSANDVEQLCSIRTRCSGLEKQVCPPIRFSCFTLRFASPSSP